MMRLRILVNRICELFGTVSFSTLRDRAGDQGRSVVPKVRHAFGPILLGLGVLLGCGPITGVTGGTPGVIRAGSEVLAEIQLTIHQSDGSSVRQIGFAPSRMDGTFQLVTNEARGPLRLAAGEYRVTLESIGSPISIPAEFSNPETTPLKINWTGREKSLDIEVPLTIAQ